MKQLIRWPTAGMHCLSLNDYQRSRMNGIRMYHGCKSAMNFSSMGRQNPRISAMSVQYHIRRPDLIRGSQFTRQSSKRARLPDQVQRILGQGPQAPRKPRTLCGPRARRARPPRPLGPLTSKSLLGLSPAPAPRGSSSLHRRRPEAPPPCARG